ncbi:unnamed protein product [Rhodiola kirilowii]
MEEYKPNVLLVVTFASTFFFALSADASWLSRFSFFPSHLQIQASSFSPNLQPAQAPAPLLSSPAPAPSPQEQAAHSPSQTQTVTISPDDPTLGDICDKTDYPTLCRSSVFPFLHNKVDHLSVIKLSIDACINHTQAAIHKASELANNPDTSEIIQVCQESYATAVDELKESALALASRDLGTFRTKMSSVITNIGTCDETFGEDPEMESSSPLTAIDQTITRLASNILAIGERI